MARRKPAARSRSRRPAAGRTAGRSPARKARPAARTTKRAPGRKTAARRKPAASTRRRAPARPKASARKAASPKKQTTRRARPARPTPAKRQARPAPVRPAPARSASTRPPAEPPRKRSLARATLDRERRRLTDDERTQTGRDRTEGDHRTEMAARAGHDELKEALALHTESSPELTGGDPDAKWEDAYAVGDEAPGGDNPTPDQDRVDDIGRALGVTYDDAEELRGSDKVADRDRHRWELDPASSDDWPHDPDKSS